MSKINPQNKYSYINRITYEQLWSNRGALVLVYPEISDQLKKNKGGGCRKCRKSRLRRAILTKIFELPVEGRNKEMLVGVFPTALLELLWNTK